MKVIIYYLLLPFYIILYIPARICGKWEFKEFLSSLYPHVCRYGKGRKDGYKRCTHKGCLNITLK